MKSRIPSLLLLIPSIAFGQPAVTNLVLNPLEVVAVLVATDRLTTISFPSPIWYLEAAYVSVDSEPPNRFQLSFQPGNTFFSVRALGTNERASVNVRWNANTYVFELIPSNQPMLALTLIEPVIPDLIQASQPPSPHRLLGILDTAKAYMLLRSQHPAMVSDIQYSPRRERFDYGAYEIALEEVFRFRAEDTLVFRVVLTNKVQTPLNYVPQSFRVQAGPRIFSPAIADGSGTVSPHTSVPVYFAVTTAPDGSRPALAINNDFTVIVEVPPSIPVAAVAPQPIGVHRVPIVPIGETAPKPVQINSKPLSTVVITAPQPVRFYYSVPIEPMPGSRR